MDTQKLKEQQTLAVSELYPLGEGPLNLFNYQASEALTLPKQPKITNKNIKIYSKVSGITHSRLKKICTDHGFKSTYQLLQYLIHCFLRVVDKDNDPIDLPVPNEIESMFTENDEWDQYKDASCFTDNLAFTNKRSQRKELTIEDFE